MGSRDARSDLEGGLAVHNIAVLSISSVRIALGNCPLAGAVHCRVPGLVRAQPERLHSKGDGAQRVCVLVPDLSLPVRAGPGEPGNVRLHLHGGVLWLLWDTASFFRTA